MIFETLHLKAYWLCCLILRINRKYREEKFAVTLSESKLSESQKSLTETAIFTVERWKKSIGSLVIPECNHAQHPRRPRGSQSGWKKRRDESFQVRKLSFRLFSRPDWLPLGLPGCHTQKKSHMAFFVFFSRHIFRTTVVEIQNILQPWQGDVTTFPLY